MHPAFKPDFAHNQKLQQILCSLFNFAIQSMSVFHLKSFIFNIEHICESIIFQKQKNMKNNLIKSLNIFWQCNTTDCISDQLHSKNKNIITLQNSYCFMNCYIMHNMTYKWWLKCNLGHANANLSYKGKTRNTLQ